VAAHNTIYYILNNTVMEYKLYHNFTTNKIILLLITDTLELGITFKNIMINFYIMSTLETDYTIMLHTKEDNTYYEYDEETDKFVNIFMSNEDEAFAYARGD
jgi:hypothetical protein